jgi:hypothetical protein
MVEGDDFRDLILYTLLYFRHNNILLRSRTLISTSLVVVFIIYQAILISMLMSCGISVHLSFDLWTSPNKYAFLGIVCYFVDSWWKARIVLLGLKRLVASHAGVDIA